MSDASKVAAVCGNPPRLNERRDIGWFSVHDGRAIRSYARCINKCGLVCEIEPGADAEKIQLYAARRRRRK